VRLENVHISNDALGRGSLAKLSMGKGGLKLLKTP